MSRLLQLALLLTLAAPASAQFHLPGSKHTDRPDRPRKSDIEWLWQYGPSDTAKEGRENELVQDLRFRPLLSQYLTAPQSFWGIATNGRYRALADTALDHLSVPQKVLADDNRYLSVSGCVVHFCPARGLLWVDLNAAPNGPAPLLAFAAIDWIKEGKTTSQPDAEYTLWLFPNQAVSTEATAPNRIPPALLRSLARWAAEPMSGSGIVQRITHAILVDPDGTPHEVPLAAVGLKASPEKKEPLMSTPTTLFEKVWQQHLVAEPVGEPALLYIDLHLVHEVTSPQAFEGLRLAGRTLRRPDRTVATVDHNVPTTSVHDRLHILDPISSKQIEALRTNCRDFGVTLYDVQAPEQGIVHMIGPELGLTKPGMTIVCGDSHTSTHGAFGALAFGIGTSEVEHVMATQTLPQDKPKTFRINVEGALPHGVTAKDIILHIIGQIGTAGATGYVVEYAGSAIRALSMEGRMTVCNMSIEAGARAGMIAPDKTTFAYLLGRRFSPSSELGALGSAASSPNLGGSATESPWAEAVAHWSQLATDEGATFDRELTLHAADITPTVSWGTSPGMVTGIDATVPLPDPQASEADAKNFARALDYMGLEPGQPIGDIQIDAAFLGSCTNARIEDLRAAAAVVRGYRVATTVRAMVVPGSQAVKSQAEDEGLDQIFKTAGFDWREPGCSMCLGMNPDILAPGERCASTSNRNFEGRQGRGGRTHLVSPAMAAAAAITGHFTDIRTWKFNDAPSPTLDTTQMLAEGGSR